MQSRVQRHQSCHLRPAYPPSGGMPIRGETVLILTRLTSLTRKRTMSSHLPPRKMQKLLLAMPTLVEQACLHHLHLVPGHLILPALAPSATLPRPRTQPDPSCNPPMTSLYPPHPSFPHLPLGRRTLDRLPPRASEEGAAANANAAVHPADSVFQLCQMC